MTEKEQILEDLSGEMDSLLASIQESEELIQQYISERSFFCEQFKIAARRYTELLKGNNEFII